MSNKSYNYYLDKYVNINTINDYIDEHSLVFNILSAYLTLRVEINYNSSILDNDYNYKCFKYLQSISTEYNNCLDDILNKIYDQASKFNVNTHTDYYINQDDYPHDEVDQLLLLILTLKDNIINLLNNLTEEELESTNCIQLETEEVDDLL